MNISVSVYEFLCVWAQCACINVHTCALVSVWGRGYYFATRPAVMKYRTWRGLSNRNLLCHSLEARCQQSWS